MAVLGHFRQSISCGRRPQTPLLRTPKNLSTSSTSTGYMDRLTTSALLNILHLDSTTLDTLLINTLTTGVSRSRHLRIRRILKTGDRSLLLYCTQYSTVISGLGRIGILNGIRRIPQESAGFQRNPQDSHGILLDSLIRRRRIPGLSRSVGDTN